MAKRVTHARAIELLGRVSDDTAGEIGELFPTGLEGAKTREVERVYFARMKELGYTEEEAGELLRYSKQ